MSEKEREKMKKQREWYLLGVMKNETDISKIQKGCEVIFKYLDENDFNLLEIEYLMTSMDHILQDIKKNDPLRKITDFNYSSSVDNAFSRTAVSNTKS